MATTLYLRDRLGCKLTNGSPGSTQATDRLGRGVAAGDKDSLGVRQEVGDLDGYSGR
jgi:hypothetical protein